MDFETAKKKVSEGHRVYAKTTDKEVGYLDSIAFGTKLDDGVFYQLMREGVIGLDFLIDGIGEFGSRL